MQTPFFPASAFFFSEIRSQVLEDEAKLVLCLRLTLNSCSSCLYLLNTEN